MTFRKLVVKAVFPTTSINLSAGFKKRRSFSQETTMQRRSLKIAALFVYLMLGLSSALIIHAQTATHKSPFDFDGDNKTDFTIWRPIAGDWYILKSSNGSYDITHFGVKSDKIVPGDYDGDGKTDVAVFRRQENI